MKASEIYNKHYDKMTSKAKKAVELSDQFFDEWAGDFETVEEFNQFIDENYNDEDL